MHCVTNINNKWSELTYPGQDRVYHGIDVTAGSWPLHYMKRDEDGSFLKLTGGKIAFELANPSFFNFENELKLVQETEEDITPEQIAIAKYWGTGVPLNQWTPIILTLINTYGVTPPRAARIMSAVQNAIADGFVICWHYKYLFDYPRPVQLNNCLKTVLNTPLFPTYPSGHSVISAAAATVLGYFFPMEEEKLDELAETASVSRLYGGIHFNADLKEGLRLGKQIGKIAVEYLKSNFDEDNTMIDIPRLDFLDAPIMPKYN